MFEETKNRSIRKSIGWRIIAVVNSYIILAFYLTESPFWNAILHFFCERSKFVQNFCKKKVTFLQKLYTILVNVKNVT